MIHNNVHHNGNLLAVKDARLSPGQSGLLNGWGVFSTLRIYQRFPFAFERHWNRLNSDATRIALTIPYPPQTVLQHLSELIDANGAEEACARVYFINNKGGYWISDEPLPEVDLLICTANLPNRKQPVRLTVHPHGRYAAHALSSAKVTAWLNNVWHLDQAQRAGFDEVIMLNARDEISECTAANIFAVRDGQVETPPVSSGCLPGVTRGVLLDVAESAGVAIRQVPLKIRDIYKADEVFITSTTREVQAVAQIDDKHFPHQPGPVTQSLAEAFSRYVNQARANWLTNGKAAR